MRCSMHGVWLRSMMSPLAPLTPLPPMGEALGWAQIRGVTQESWCRGPALLPYSGGGVGEASEPGILHGEGGLPQLPLQTSPHACVPVIPAPTLSLNVLILQGLPTPGSPLLLPSSTTPKGTLSCLCSLTVHPPTGGRLCRLGAGCPVGPFSRNGGGPALFPSTQLHVLAAVDMRCCLLLYYLGPHTGQVRGPTPLVQLVTGLRPKMALACARGLDTDEIAPLPQHSDNLRSDGPDWCSTERCGLGAQRGQGTGPKPHSQELGIWMTQRPPRCWWGLPCSGFHPHPPTGALTLTNVSPHVLWGEISLNSLRVTAKEGVRFRRLGPCLALQRGELPPAATSPHQPGVAAKKIGEDCSGPNLGAQCMGL